MGFEIVPRMQEVTDMSLYGAAEPGGADGVKGSWESHNGSEVDVSLCAVCQGSGLMAEEYHYRRMEKSCTQCSGRGVLITRNGQAAPEGPSSSIQARTDAAAEHKQRSDRIRQLSANLANIQQRIAQHTQERNCNRAALEAAPADARELGLRRELMQQLDKQLVALEAAAARSRQRLATLTSAAA